MADISRMKAINKRMSDAMFGADTMQTFIDEMGTPDMVLHDAPVPEPIRGREAVKAHVAKSFTGSSDFHLEDDVVIAEGDYLAGHRIGSWIETGPIPGVDLDPTGKRVSMESMYMLRFEGEKVAEYWIFYDSAAIFAQLGVTPQLATTPA